MADATPPQPPRSPSRYRRIHDLTHLLVRGLMVVLAVGLVTVGALALRLLFGPMPVEFLEPLIRSRMVVGEGSQLEFEDATLALRRKSPGDKIYIPGLELRLSNVKLLAMDQGVSVNLPEGAVTLSLPALLHGDLVARSLSMRGLALTVTWRGGDIFAALAADGDTGPLAKLLPMLLLPQGASGNADLRRVRLIDTAILINEAETGSVWRLNALDLELERDANTLELLGSSTLVSPSLAEAPLRLSGRYDPTTGETALNLAFSDLNPAVLAGESQLLGRLKGVNLPLAGTVTLAMNKDSGVIRAGAVLSAAAGDLILPFDPAPPAIKVDGLALDVFYDVASEHLDINSFDARVAGGWVRGDGEWTRDEEGQGLKFNGTVKGLEFPQLQDYWPEGLAEGARNWIVRNITAGRVDDGVLVLDLPIVEGDEPLPQSAVDFQFNFSGLTTHYLRPMPPITGGSGYARLTAQDMTVNVAAGAAAGVAVAGSKVRLRNIHVRRGATAEVDAKLSGTIPAVLQLIDSEPLGYPSKYGIKPGSIQGTSRQTLTMSIPLLKTVTLGDVKFDVDAALADVRIAELFENVTLTAPALHLQVDAKALQGSGGIRLNDTPFQLTWHEDFDAEGRLPTRFELSGMVEGPGWQVLKLPLAPWVDGPTRVTLNLHGRGPEIMQGDGSFDFAAAALQSPSLGWRKDKGTPGVARFQFDRGGKDVLNVRGLMYEDAALRVSGTLTVDDQPGVRDMLIDSLKIGETQLAAAVTRQEKPDSAANYHVSVTADSFDARPFLSRLFSSDTPAANLPDMELDILAAGMVGLNDVLLHNVTASARFAGGQWGNSTVKGAFKDGGDFDFELTEPAAGAAAPERRHYVIRSDNAAQVVRVLGLFKDAVGGALEFTGSMTPTGPDQVVDGLIRIDGFRVVRANVLARLLSVGSLTGISDLLRGEGIRFERLNAPFQMTRGIMELKGARAWGPAIGLTADGKISLNANEAALVGAVVPAYTANSILGRLPLIGNLIVGGEGGGIFAFTYNITGKLDDPEVSVNALSVLTPGFLRNIFEGAPKLEEEKKR